MENMVLISENVDADIEIKSEPEDIDWQYLTEHSNMQEQAALSASENEIEIINKEKSSDPLIPDLTVPEKKTSFNRCLTLAVMKLINPAFVEDSASVDEATDNKRNCKRSLQKRKGKCKTAAAKRMCEKRAKARKSERDLERLYNRINQVKQRLLKQLREPEKLEQIKRSEAQKRREERQRSRTTETAEQLLERKIKQNKIRRKIHQKFKALATPEEIEKRKTEIATKRRLKEQELKTKLTQEERAEIFNKKKKYMEKYMESYKSKNGPKEQTAVSLDPKTGRMRQKPGRKRRNASPLGEENG